MHVGHAPFIRFLLALLAGVAVAYAVPPQGPYHVAAWVVFWGALGLFVGLIALTRLRQSRYYRFIGFAALLALGAVGLLRTWQPHPDIDRSHFSHFDSRALVVRVADEPVLRGDRVRFPCAVIGIHNGVGIQHASGLLMVTVNLEDSVSHPSLSYGDELLLPAGYREVPPPYNPDEFDYRGYLANKSIWHQQYVQDTQLVRLATGKGNPLVSYALQLRQNMVTKFAYYISDKDALSVVSTLILGYRAELSEALLQAFSNTGTIHVLSVSGMHVMMVFWLLNIMLRWMGRSRPLRTTKFIILVLAIWGYALLTGFAPAVLRASIMASFVVAADTFGQRNRVYNSIAASAFFLLVYNPKFVADVGFQLSYFAVLGIVLLYPLLRRTLPTNHRVVKPILDTAWISIAAQTGAGPLAAYYFHQFPLYFLPANLFIVLPATMVMYLGFALLFVPFEPLAAGMGYVLQQIVLAMNATLSYVEQLPMASIQGLWMSWWEIGLVYLLIFSAVAAGLWRRKALVYSALACGVLLLLSTLSASVARQGKREVIVFNVGKDVAIGFLQQGKAWVYTNLYSVANSSFRYSVLPTLERHIPAESFRLVEKDSSYHDDALYIRSGILQFGDVRLIVYDGNQVVNGRIETDILLVRRNSNTPLDQLMGSIRCKRLVLDGSNSEETIQRFQAEAAALGIPVYVLKNNFAYVITPGSLPSNSG